MSYLQKYVFVNKTKDINVQGFNMITSKHEAKTIKKNIFHVIINANSIVKHVTQTKNGIMKHVNVSAKNIVHAKKIIAGILAHVLLRIISI